MDGMWSERIEDRLIVRCNRTMDAWYLTCRLTKWVGSVSNCSEGQRRDDDDMMGGSNEGRATRWARPLKTYPNLYALKPQRHK